MISRNAACTSRVGMSKTEADVLEAGCVVSGGVISYLAYGTFLIYVIFTILNIGITDFFVD